MSTNGSPLSLVGYHLTFDDEFGTFASSPDGSSGWQTQYPWNSRTHGGANEIQYYSDSSIGYNPFSTQSGELTITAKPGSNPAGYQYNSGIINSEHMFSQTYGYFEMRAELPQGSGMWPAFWLNPATTPWPPEIDVMEAYPGYIGNNSFESTLWWGTSANPQHQSGGVMNMGTDLTAGYHTYGVNWQSDTCTFYFDGKQVAQIPTPAGMNVPMYMIANLAVGNQYWTGYNTGETSQMKIDYIRAYSAHSSDPAVSAQSVSSPDGAATNYYGASVGSPPGSVGTDTLSLILSEDAYKGNALFIVSVDGTKIGGPTPVVASHGYGQEQVFNFSGTWAAGNHVVKISFVNDLYGGSASKDRNLYVEDVRFNGTSFLGHEAALHSNGSISLTVTDHTT